MSSAVATDSLPPTSTGVNTLLDVMADAAPLSPCLKIGLGLLAAVSGAGSTVWIEEAADAAAAVGDRELADHFAGWLK